LAQASAIRANQRYQIQFINATSYRFLENSPNIPGYTSDFVGNEGRIGRVVIMDPPVIFTPGSVPCGILPCSTPIFRPDGTIDTSGANSSLRLTDTKEAMSLSWSIGGAIRIQ